jgi:hypothetical protein
MLEEAMFRSPNPQLFREYRAFHDKAEDLLRTAFAQRPLIRADLVLAIQSVLNIISTMASQFANADEDVNYGANIMLVASPSSGQGQPLDSVTYSFCVKVNRPTAALVAGVARPTY